MNADELEQLKQAIQILITLAVQKGIAMSLEGEIDEDSCVVKFVNLRPHIVVPQDERKSRG